ncbi:hypothetical protein ABZ345_34060 [Lentzea sp. NPDC005914]|uniref:hypothetical protein n=1 Tax=Lentzea sp. NPDC005914 TaxID=3154572 RepID=UPI0033D1F8A3
MTSRRKPSKSRLHDGSYSVYAPFEWAKTVPLLMRGNGTPDTTAHHVLLVMATFADPDGTNVRPSVATLTKESHFAKQRTTLDALRRLEDEKLIVRTGEMTGGTVVWKLNYELEFDSDSVADEFDDRFERERKKQAERSQRYRDAKRARHAAVERDADASVTPQRGVTSRSTEASRHAAVEHCVTPPTPSHLQVSPATPALDQPLTSPETNGGHAGPCDPRRTESPQAAPRTDLEPEPAVLPEKPTQVDLSTHVLHARARELASVDFLADDTELDAEEISSRVEVLKALDPVRYRNARFAARKALGLSHSVTTSPKHREALNREIYRAHRAEGAHRAS